MIVSRAMVEVVLITIGRLAEPTESYVGFSSKLRWSCTIARPVVTACEMDVSFPKSSESGSLLQVFMARMKVV